MASMKGLSNTLWIVITAVIIIVIALVLLTIFARGITPISSLADFRQQCEVTASLSCRTTGFLPMNWNTQVLIGDEPSSCAAQFGNAKNCEEAGFQTIKAGETPSGEAG